MVTNKETNILAEKKPKSITLSDGKEYTLPVINLTTLANVEEALGCGLSQLQGLMETKTVTIMRDILCVLLKENYPDLTPVKVGELIPLKQVKEVADIIGSIFSDMG